MSNQLQITGAAKVRGLEGVLTGTSGIVGALGINVANGIPKLDSNGKILVSQLPSSVMEYKGTWNAATNTPTLANGTGDTGDVYLCNVAGTTNFGAGPITFAVGDQVIYSGSIWQKASGATGTVTSVAMTVPSGLTVTGSPITTSGTLAVSLTSGYTIPTTSFLSGLVPYTGATQTVDLGSYDLNARGIKINGTGGLGHADFKHQSGTPTGSASSSTLYANTDGDLAWLNDHSHTITLAASANTADRTYTFPDTNGKVAILEAGNTFTNVNTFTNNINIDNVSPTSANSINFKTTSGGVSYAGAGYMSLFSTTAKSLTIMSTDTLYMAALGFSSLTASRNFSFPDASGTIALTSNLSSYVPYTGATSQVDLGSNNLYGKSLNVWGDGTNGGGLNLKQYTSQSFLPGYGYTAVYTDNSYGFSVWFLNGASTARQITFSASLLGNGTGQIYNLPASNGTIALTSDIPSLANYVTTNTNQTISGIKTFSNEQLFGNGITLTGGYITYTSGSFNLTLNTNLLTANRNVFLQDKAGTIALTSDLTGGTVTSVGLSSATSGVTIGSSPITTSGTITLAIATASGSQQGLLSSTDWTTFNNKQNALTNPVTGTGTSSYHAKFTGTSTIGNSMLTDDGTTLQSIGATRSNLYLKAASNSYYSQLAFTNGTNGSFGGLSYNNASQYMQFEVNSSEYMRLYGNGNLRLFSSSATDSGYKLQVEGTGTFSGNVGIGGGANERLTITGPSGLAGMVRWTDATTGSAFLGFTSGGTAYIHCNNNALAFGANGSNNFAATMTLTSGNVGIGTSSPSSYSHGGTNVALEVSNSATTANAQAHIILSTGATSNTGSIGTISWAVPNTAGNKLGALIASNLESNSATNPYTNITFYNSNGGGPTERMRIAANGSVCIGRTSGDGKLNLDGTIYLYNTSSGAGNSTLKYNTSTGQVTFDTSARIFKKEITDLEHGLNAVLKMSSKKYKWKSNNQEDLGFIADEMYKVVPEVVFLADSKINTSDLKNGEPMGINYDRLIPVLVKAIQELNAKVTALEQKT